MRKCPVCEHDNREGEIFCQHCGASLESATLGASTATLDSQPDAQAVRDKLGTATFGDARPLLLEVEGSTKTLVVHPESEVVLGRRDPVTNAVPEVDFTSFAGYRMGVSRRHATIVRAGANLHLTDLGSSNGTFLNGQRLAPNRPYTLHDGDEVRLGQLVLCVRFG